MTFRILTERSKMKFGKYSDMTVKSILALGEPDYLRWVYYNSSHISFDENVLILLGITESFRIEKPGVNDGKRLELELYLRDAIHANYKPLTQTQIYLAAQKKKRWKAQLKVGQARAERKFNVTRGSQQKKNHGKGKQH